MRNRIITLLQITFGVFSFCHVANAASDSITVGPKGDYATIEAAIEAISSKKTAAKEIIVEPDTYSVNLNLISDITIRGRETARTILKAKSNQLPVLILNNVSNVKIANFTITESQIGLSVTGSNSTFIQNNVFHLGTDEVNRKAIIAQDNSPISVINNTFYKNAVALDAVVSYLGFFAKNNIFVENTTVASALIPEANINYNCFYKNTTTPDYTIGSNAVLGDPLFSHIPTTTDDTKYDFHLKTGSPCIDKGDSSVKDVFDDTTSDLGAYGGELADTNLFPVTLTLGEVTATGNGLYQIEISWTADASYHISDTTSPGYYKLYYDTVPFNESDNPTIVDAGQSTAWTISDLAAATNTLSAPTGLSLSPYSKAIDVSWNSVSDATGYRVLYGEASTTESSQDTGSNTSAAIDNLNNGTTYMVGVVALKETTYYFYVRAFSKDEKFSTYATAALVKNKKIGDPQQGPMSEIKTAIPEDVEPVPQLPNEGCFIATAAFGYYDAPEVQGLREFRDKVLLQSAIGSKLVSWYYQVSPTVAAWLNAHTEFKPIVRILLWPAIQLAPLIIHYPQLTALILLLALGVIIGYTACAFPKLRKLKQ